MCNIGVLSCADTSILGLALVVSITSTAPVRASDCCAPCNAPSPAPSGHLFPITVKNNICNNSYGPDVTVTDGKIWLYPTGTGTWYYQKSSSATASYCVWPKYSDGRLRPLSLGEITGNPTVNGQGTVWVSNPANAVLQAFAYDCVGFPDQCEGNGFLYPKFAFTTNSASRPPANAPTSQPMVMSATFEISQNDSAPSTASGDLTAIDQFSLATQFIGYEEQELSVVKFKAGFTGADTTATIVQALKSNASGGSSEDYIDCLYPTGLGTAVWNAPSTSPDAHHGTALWRTTRQYPQYFNAATTRPQVPANWLPEKATWFGSTPGLFPSAWAPFNPTKAYTGPQSAPPQWATVVTPSPTLIDIPDHTLRNAVISTGLPWKVRDNQTNLEMVLIPPGKFEMGCSNPPNPEGPNGGCVSFSLPSEGYGNEFPTQEVAITRPFYLSMTEVTQAAWALQSISGLSSIDDYDCSACPIENITWQQIQDFLGKTALRLPTEAEWEFAYRAGTTTAYHGYPGQTTGTNDGTPNGLGQIAIFGQSGQYPGQVKTKDPNGFGLFDMAGNVWEWVADPYETYPNPASPQPIIDRFGEINADNPVIAAVPPDSTATGGSMYYGVMRGGAFDRPSWECTAARRDVYYTKGVFKNRVGFRVARSAGTLPVVPNDFVTNNTVPTGGSLPYGKLAASSPVSLGGPPVVGTLVWGPTKVTPRPVTTDQDPSEANLVVIGSPTSFATYLELLSRHPANKNGFLLDYGSGWIDGYCSTPGQEIRDCETTDFVSCNSSPAGSGTPHVGKAGYSFRLQVTGVPPNQGLKIFDITYNRWPPTGANVVDEAKAAAQQVGVTLMDGDVTQGYGVIDKYYYTTQGGPFKLWYCCSSSAMMPAGNAGADVGCGDKSAASPNGSGWTAVQFWPFATAVSWETTLQGSENWDNEGVSAMAAPANSYITIAANGTTIAVPKQPPSGVSGILPYYPLDASATDGSETINVIANWTDNFLTSAAAGMYPRKYAYESAWLTLWEKRSCGQDYCTPESGDAPCGMSQGCYGLDEVMQLHNWPASQTTGVNNELRYAGRTGTWTQQLLSNIAFTLSTAITYGMLPVDPNEPWTRHGEGFAFLSTFLEFSGNYGGGGPKPTDPKPTFKNFQNPSIAGGAWYPYVLLSKMYSGTPVGYLPAYVTTQGDRFSKNSPLFTVGGTLGQNVWVLSPQPDPPHVLSDLDASGCVDSNDLTLLLAGWGAPCGKVGCEEDLNGDGLVDGADLAVLFSEWGLGCGGSP